MQCPDPIIDSFFPISGPPEGGTTITILGRDLGITYSEIEDGVILNGEFICETQQDRYIPGHKIVCDTPNFGSLATPYPVEFNITVMLIGGGRRPIAIGFPFTVTRASIVGIFPAFGPIAGGSLITVRGNNLDIGNVEETCVTLNGKECIIQ